MKYYPMFLRVAGRSCLVIGGGNVAAQKVDGLLAAGARVTVISPELCGPLEALAAAGKMTHLARAYAPGDVRGFFLVFAATDDQEVQSQVVREAHELGVLLNVVDRPTLCDFIAPAVIERGDLTIAVSTSGTSPALARQVRRQLAARFGPEYALALQLLRRLRERLVAPPQTAADRQRIFTALVESPLLDYLREHRIADIDRLLAQTVGNGVSVAELGVELT
jgi:precorrin-2 dehydrogenase/sirohydrochlorin ferrochelatase